MTQTSAKYEQTGVGMAARVSKDERLDRLVQQCRDRIEELEEPPRSLSHAPDSKLRVLLAEAGYMRTSPKFLERLDSALHKAGIGTFPELDDPTNERETRIYLYDLDHPIPGLQPSRVLFSDEAGLEMFLVNNFRAMEYFRTNKLDLRGRQVHIAPGCVIDLLAEHRRSRQLVGIELKAREPGERLLAQVDRYVEALAELAQREERPSAKLLIVTGQPDERTQVAIEDVGARHGVEVEWLLYRLQLKLTSVSSS